MSKVWILVLSLGNGDFPVEIAAYDSLGDCLDVSYYLTESGVSLPATMYCEESSND